MRRILPLAGVLIIGAVVHTRAAACIPPPPDPLESSQASVMQRFNAVDSVMLVTLLKSRKVKVKEGGIDFAIEADEDTFRVDRVFKGDARPGQQFVLITTVMCAMSPHQWLSYPDAKPMDIPRQWLFYRDFAEQSQFIDSPMMRPLERVSGQLPILAKLASNNSYRHSVPPRYSDPKQDRKLIVVE